MKRQRSSHGSGGPRKKPRRPVRTLDQSALATTPGTDHPVLQRLYPKVLTLRHYLLAQLPTSSRGRRRRISQLGLSTVAENSTSTRHVDTELGQLLDSALVGLFPGSSTESEEQVTRERRHDIDLFTQQRLQGATGGTFQPGYRLQSEVCCDTNRASKLLPVASCPHMDAEHTQIVDFVIWRLFRRSTSHKPSHLLCHGFQRSGSAPRTHIEDIDPASSIPGLLARHPNSNVQTLKKPTWCRLHALLGPGGDLIMMNLLLECSIFLPVAGNLGNYFQLSGIPMSELKFEQISKDPAIDNQSNPTVTRKPLSLTSENRTPGSITFVRSRMLYAKAALNAKGGVRFGMRHIRWFHFGMRDLDND